MRKQVPEVEHGDSVQDRLNVMYDTLRHRICTLRYPPNYRLSETALAQEFACSRTPVRRVLAWLEREELIVSRQGVGTFVTSLGPDEVAQNFVVRAALEQAVIDLAPISDPSPLVERFDTLHNRCTSMSANPDVIAFAELEMEAFDAFVATTSNDALKLSCKSYYGRTTRHQIHRLMRNAGWFQSAYENLCSHACNMHVAMTATNLEAAAHYQIAYTRMIAR